MTLQQPKDHVLVTPGEPVPVAGVAAGTGGLEPHPVSSVSVSVDGGAAVAAATTAHSGHGIPAVTLTTSVTFTVAGEHELVVTAVDDVGSRGRARVVVLVTPSAVSLPSWHATAHSLDAELAAIASRTAACASIYLDTQERHNNHDVWPPWGSEGADHHQGVARTHRLWDGSVHVFLTHSEMDFGDKGNLLHFRYDGPVDGEHLQTTEPPTVAPMAQLLETASQHPCDLAVLPEVNADDCGYLFVAGQTPLWRGVGPDLQVVGTSGWLGVYRWSGGEPFQPWGAFAPGQLSGPPNFVFLDRFGDTYVLGVVPAYDEHGHVDVFTARAGELFPQPVAGFMDLGAFRPSVSGDLVEFPVSSDACQVHTVADSTGSHFLLAFRGEPPDKEDAEDYVDVHALTFPPLRVSARRGDPVHVTVPPGDTSFASTGTLYVDPSGRMLVASTYRWAEEPGPGVSGYASRLDECSS